MAPSIRPLGQRLTNYCGRPRETRAARAENERSAQHDEYGDEMAAPKIGEMNGRWAVLLKFVLATYPVVLVWAGWIQTSLHNVDNRVTAIEASRFTASDGAALRDRVMEKANVPPTIVVYRLDTMEAALVRIEAKIDRFHLPKAGTNGTRTDDGS